MRTPGTATTTDWPRAEYWDRRLVGGRTVRAQIADLDPVRDDAEIVHLSSEVLTPPVLAHIGYATAAIRTVCVPRVADRLVRGGSGPQVLWPWRRDARTLRMFGLLMRFGYRSAAGQDLCDRVQAVHRSVSGVLHEDQLYTLGALILFPDRLAVAMGRRFSSDHEEGARSSFWTGVGTAMGLREMPETTEEWSAWMLDYEARLFEPSDDAHAVAEAHLVAIGRWFPPANRGLARLMVATALGEDVRRCIGYAEPSVTAQSAQRTLWRTFAPALRLRAVRLDSSWTTAFPDEGPRTWRRIRSR